MGLRISPQVACATITQAFLNAGLSQAQAQTCAEIHTNNSMDGVESHGLNRVPRFIDYVQKGWIDVSASPELIHAKGSVENYDGHRGIGVLNARFAMGRATDLARTKGIGCVTMRNTTHWMRGGAYAWEAAEAGFIGINWTNTESCMPLWGSQEVGVGNNPFCIAIPRESGPIVLDMAMSQYSYGKIGTYRLAGKQLPYPGGYDDEGALTCDPAAIEHSRRILPAGYWKGSGLALVLDLAAAAMAAGMTGTDMDDEGQGSCSGCSQVFIAYDPYMFMSIETMQHMFDERVARADATTPVRPGDKVTCPGERTVERHRESEREGLLVNEEIWQQIQQLSAGNMDITDIS